MADGWIQEYPVLGFGELAVDKHGIAEHQCYVVDLGCFLCVGNGFNASAEHGVTEGAAHSDFLSASLDGLGRTVFIDAGAEFFFHKHPGAAGTAAESLVFGSLHLREFHSRCTKKFTGWVEDFIVTAQEAWVVICDGLAIFRPARNRSEEFFTYQAVE